MLAEMTLTEQDCLSFLRLFQRPPKLDEYRYIPEHGAQQTRLRRNQDFINTWQESL